MGQFYSFAQSDMGQNFSLSLNFLYIKGPFSLSLNFPSVKGPFYSSHSPTWDETFHCHLIFCMSRDHSTVHAVRHGTKLITVIKFYVCQRTILQLAQSDMGQNFLLSLKFLYMYVNGPLYSSRSPTWDETFHCH